jgi:hypothetical protein
VTNLFLVQAEVLKDTLTDTSSLVGGMRVVELRAKGKVKYGRMDTWVQELGWVMADNFDCQYFFKTGTSSKPFRVSSLNRMLFQRGFLRRWLLSFANLLDILRLHMGA